jgi:hypothetical protein
MLAYDILLGLGLNARTSPGKFERFERLRTVFFLSRQGADDTDVRVAAECILKQMSELRVAVGNVATEISNHSVP